MSGNIGDALNDITKPVDEFFRWPNPDDINYWLIGVLILVFAYLVFLFFSWHTAFFYVDGELFYKEARPFMHDVLPPEPTKEGHRFIGWCKDAECCEPAAMPCSIRLFNAKYYAHFEPISAEEAEAAEALSEADNGNEVA